MKRLSLSLVIAASLLLSSCMVVPAPYGPPGYGYTDAVPVLPPVVYLGSGPYYKYNGFHYRYDHNKWLYSRSERGPWNHLPRDHYPREVRHGAQGHDSDRGHRGGRNWSRDRGHQSERR